MKIGVSKQELIDSLSETLSLTRERVDHLELKDNDTVVIHYKGGYQKSVNIAMDSGLAIILDVSRAV